MSQRPDQTCETCGEVKTTNSFYKNHGSCRACVTKAARAQALTLPDKVESHRQEKEVKKLLRAELKKIALARLTKRKQQRRVRAQKTLIPQVPEGEPVVVDPAVKELAQRELVRRRLIEFIKEFHPRYKAGWVHHDICRRLEQFVQDVAAGRSPRLMILMPPRHGKSQIASKMLPPWTLGHYPHFEIIACSYNVSLALEFSREARGLVSSDRFQLLFPRTTLDESAKGAEAWKLISPTGVGAGGYVAAGIGGPITGKGAHILIIDDPIKNAEEAESAEQRQKIWDWYGSTAYTRLAPGGGVLVIQTWWHDDDLAGRLQEEMKADDGADVFEVVKYPAIAIEDEEYRAAGEPLHPERYDMEALLRIKRTIGKRFWSALYQQDPVPDEGAYFSKEMFIYRKDVPDHARMNLYQAWDFSLGEKKANDYNVGVTIGQDYNDDLHVLDVVRFRTLDLGRTVEEMLNMYEKWPNVQQVGVEDGKEWRGMQPLLKKRMTERQLYPNFGKPLQPLTDKQIRARPLQGRMQNGKVTFPRSAHWLEAAEREILRFPSGLHDDIVDALAWGVTILLGRAPPKIPVYRNSKREKTLAEKLREMGHLAGGESAMAA